MSLLEPFLFKWSQNLWHKITEVTIKSYHSLSKIQCFMYAPRSLGSSIFMLLPSAVHLAIFLGWLESQPTPVIGRYSTFLRSLPYHRYLVAWSPSSQLHSSHSKSLSAETTYFRHILKGLRSLNNLVTPAFCVPTKWAPHGWGQGLPLAWSFWTLVAVVCEYLGGRTWGTTSLWGPLQTEYPSGSFLSRKNLSRDLVISYLWPNGACSLERNVASL